MYKCNRCGLEHENPPAVIEEPSWDSDTGRPRVLCLDCSKEEEEIKKKLVDGLKL